MWPHVLPKTKFTYISKGKLIKEITSEQYRKESRKNIVLTVDDSVKLIIK